MTEPATFDPTPYGIWVGERPYIHHERPEWRPIGTAPQDGAWLHAYSPRLDNCLVMKFKQSSGYFVDVHDLGKENWSAPDMQPTLWAPWVDYVEQTEAEGGEMTSLPGAYWLLLGVVGGAFVTLLARAVIGF